VILKGPVGVTVPGAAVSFFLQEIKTATQHIIRNIFFILFFVLTGVIFQLSFIGVAHFIIELLLN